MPSASASYVPTRELAAELARRAPRIARSLLRRRGPSAPVGSSASEPFAVLEREGRPPVQLASGYRDRIKRSWRSNFWQVNVLLELDSRVELSAELAGLADEIRASRTLPVAPAEVGASLAQVLDRYSDQLRATGVRDDISGQEKLVVLETRESTVGLAEYYRETARRFARELEAHGVALEGARGLELGCGTGYLLYALAGRGPQELVGIDVAFDAYGDDDASGRRHLMRDLLAREHAQRIEFVAAAAESLPFDDGRFDFSISLSAMEHFRKLGDAFREQARVLRPGGVGYHTILPWFSPGGGHSLCTLDFPWGHARLTPDEFVRYVEEYRPHEVPSALASYRIAFPEPRFTLGDVERWVVEAGLELITWIDGSGFESHRSLLDRAVLDDCRAIHPGVTVRDLMASDYFVVFRRPA